MSEGPPGRYGGSWQPRRADTVGGAGRRPGGRVLRSRSARRDSMKAWISASTRSFSASVAASRSLAAAIACLVSWMATLMAIVIYDGGCTQLALADDGSEGGGKRLEGEKIWSTELFGGVCVRVETAVGARRAVLPL